LEALAEVERAFVHVDYAKRDEPEHRTERLLAGLPVVAEEVLLSPAARTPATGRGGEGGGGGLSRTFSRGVSNLGSSDSVASAAVAAVATATATAASGSLSAANGSSTNGLQGSDGSPAASGDLETGLASPPPPAATSATAAAANGSPGKGDNDANGATPPAAAPSDTARSGPKGGKKKKGSRS
jgi:hypothetical protein